MRCSALWVLLLAAAALPAAAAPCYVVYDRADAVIYRDYTPPFDLSDGKAPERAMMRQQGQHLLIAEFDNCDPVGFISPTTGATTATVEEIVNGVQPAIATSVAKGGGTAKGAVRPGSAPAARPGATAAAATAAAKKGY
jgi:hypothetical protein